MPSEYALKLRARRQQEWWRIPMPRRVQQRPRDYRGFVIPYSVDDGTNAPDFRITQTTRVRELVRTQACWVCGLKRQLRMCFIGGPLSITNHLFSDGWVHPACGLYALRVCPYLARPQAGFNGRELPEGVEGSVNLSSTRPERFGMVFTSTFSTLLDEQGGLIMRAGVYFKIHWFSEWGRLERISSGSVKSLKRNRVRNIANEEAADRRSKQRRRIARANAILRRQRALEAERNTS